jgi:flagellar motility protein MotE (MotC chaperone)
MKNMLMMLMAGAVIFGAAASGSWFLQNQKAAASHDEEDGDHDESHAAAKPTAAVAEAHGENEGDEKKTAALPASVRPRPVSVEELLRYSLGLKSREEALSSREKDIDRRQSQVNIVLADIQGEQRELDGLRSQVKQQLASVELLLEQVQADREKFKADKAEHEQTLEELGSTQATVDAAQWDNVRKMSTWFQSMDPEKAAGVLKELSDDGKLDLAVQLLSSFGEREASKVLSAIEDTSLTVQLAEAFRTFKKPPKKEEKKR